MHTCTYVIKVKWGNYIFVPAVQDNNSQRMPLARGDAWNRKKVERLWVCDCKSEIRCH